MSDVESEKPIKRTKKKSNKSKRANADDTPKSFSRLMELRQRMATPKPKVSKQESQKSKPTLQIKRGESMAEFSRRVNEAVPLPRARGINSSKAEKTSKKQRAKAENLRQEYADRLRKRREGNEDDEDMDLHVEDDGEDVWAHLKAKANKPKFGEVADRPPELPALKRKGGVPKSAGSLARREILEQERERIIEHFRNMKETQQ